MVGGGAFRDGEGFVDVPGAVGFGVLDHVTHGAQVVGPAREVLGFEGSVRAIVSLVMPDLPHGLLELGILNHLVSSAEIESFAATVAARVCRNSPLAIRSFKRQFRLLSSGLPLSAETFELIQSIRREVYDSKDYLEGIQSFHEKRPPVFRGE